ncbi:Uma2 family endonuclease [Leptolyngbya sp. NK1-12]|uniref:Uma2 family endonuclease n=1 Tax=Leptolyngbya sp. NK1-12 TaxID=2547451 RepID=A0AA97AEY6_9CYAN|nr:Uma2 family endonuclease [Leptolyngbya sp. NK1-12]WNZ22590.1 Uma2 family endonuclease [Leptolyngbya sp. NK1-12]
MTGAVNFPTLTLEEFLKRPETKPASEFVEGRIEQRPMPQGKHSRLQWKFCDAVNAVAEAAQIAMAFPELRCTFGNRSIVPDAAVFVWERIPFDAAGEIANTFAQPPDWTVEILSPEQKTTRVIRNILHCLNYGAQLGWMIDPDERIILVFRPAQLPTEFREDEVLPVLPGVDLVLTVNNVFNWLKGQR